MRIRTKLFIAFVGVTFLPMFFSGIIIYNTTRQQIIADLVKQLDQTASYFSETLRSSIKQSRNVFFLITSSTKLRELLKEYNQIQDPEHLNQIHDILEDAKKSVSDLVNAILIFDKNGKLLIGTETPNGVEKYTHIISKLKKLNATNVNVSFVTSAETGRALLISGPIKLNGEILANAFVFLSIQSIDDIIDNKNFESGRTDDVLLAEKTDDEDARFVVPTRFQENRAETLLVLKSKRNLPIIRALNKEQGVFISRDTINYLGHRVFSATRYLDDLKWGLAVSIDQSEALSSVNKLRKYMLFLGAVITALVLLMVFFVASNLTKPLVELALFASNFRKGTGELQISPDLVQSLDEIGELARSFLNLTEELIGANKLLEKSNQEFKKNNLFLDSVIENIPNMIFLKEVNELRFRRFNKAAEELLGLTREEVMDKNDYDFFPKEQADFFTKMDRQVLDSGKMLDIPEEPVKSSQKGVRFLHTKKIPLMSAEGTPEYLLGISEDVTEKKEALEVLKNSHAMLELKVKERTEELELLLYTASHDLRSPLVTVQGFTGILEKQLEGYDNQLAKESILRIQSAVKRMGELINDLLEFYRVSQKKPDQEKHEVSAILHAVSENLIGLLSAAKASLVIEDSLPKLKLPKNEIEHVFENLIANAIKYGCEQPDSVITVGYKEFLEEHRFYVRDQGPGIPDEHKNKIFMLFKRLNVRKEGTGLGLAIVSKIIYNLGGKVWVEDGEEKGSVFWISLPKQSN